MMRFIAMLRDSLKEAVDGWIFLVMLGLSGLLILIVASASVRPLPVEEAVPLMFQNEVMQFISADRGRSTRTALFMHSHQVSDVVPIESGEQPWNGEFHFTLTFSRLIPGMGGGVEIGEGRDAKSVNPGDVKKIETQSGLFSDPIEDAVRYWAAQAGAPSSDWPKFTKDLAAEFVAYQVHAASGLEVVKVERKRSGTYDVTARSESRLRWPHTPAIFFGALNLPFLQEPLGDLINTIEGALVSGLGAWVVVLAGIVVTAGFIPNMLRKGAIDLLLTKPMSRPLILVYKYLGGLLFVGMLTAITALGIWAAIGMRTGVWTTGLLVAGLAIIYYFAILYAFSTLVGVLSRNAIVCIVATCMLWVVLFVIGIGHQFLSAFDRIDHTQLNKDVPNPILEFKPPQWAVTTMSLLNRATPRTRDLNTLTKRVVGEGLISEGEQARQRKETADVDWPEVIGVSLAYIGLFLGLAVLRFVTRSY